VCFLHYHSGWRSSLTSFSYQWTEFGCESVQGGWCSGAADRTGENAASSQGDGQGLWAKSSS